jgi:DNA-binding transcriptional LysR family regulator
MELRRLRYFVTVAEEMHFGRAAQRLHMAQQPLSAQVRELEREIGCDLFERYANRIRLTPAGHVFLTEARAILERSVSAVERARRAAKGETGIVRVGYCGTAMDRVLPATMRILQEKHPEVGFDLRELSHAEQIRAIERDELDVGFVYLPVDERTFYTLDLFNEGVVVAIPADHLLGANDRVTLSQLAGMPLIVVSGEQNPANTTLLAEVLTEISFQGPPKISGNDLRPALALVAHGFGIAILPQHSAAPRSDVAYVPLDLPVTLHFAAIWSKLGGEGVLRQRFLEALVEAADAVPAPVTVPPLQPLLTSR